MVLKKSFKYKSKTLKSKGYLFLMIIVILLLFDRLTKIWASSLQINKDYGIIAFTYITNSGAGFSIMQNMNTLLAIIAVMALAVIIYYHKHVPKLSLILIISGIIGNLIDRLFYGSVIDFINFKFWPVFNIADSLVFIGVIYWIIILFKEENKEKKLKKK